MYHRRVPLRDHPLFVGENGCQDTSQPDSSRVVLGDISNTLINVKETYKKASFKERSRVPLREHPHFQNVNDSDNKTGDEVRTYKFGHSVVQLCNKRRKGCSDKENNLSHSTVLQSTPQNSKTGFSDGCSGGMLNHMNIDPPHKISNVNFSSNLEGLERILFSNESSSNHSTDETDYSNAEFSTIVSSVDTDISYSSDDDNGWTDEITDDLTDSLDEVCLLNATVPAEYVSLGAPNKKCEYCHALMWNEERLNKQSKKGNPKFSLCCRKGLIKLPKAPRTPSFLWQIINDPKQGSKFQQCSRIYNSMFCFTSIGGSVDNSINNGGGPYIYKLNGQNHHVFGSLIPNDGDDPKFCQLYIYDTDNELQNRMQWIDVKEGYKIKEYIVDGLMKMFDETNELVKTFRIARDRFEESPVVELKIILKVCRAQSGRENHIGVSDEVAAIMVGDQEDPCESRDIIIENKSGGLQRITNIHPKLMALQYPVLFPNGEDGFHKDIKYVDTNDESCRKRDNCSMKDFYSYKFQVRLNEGMTPRLGGRLYQQYVVDAFSAIEQSRLWWFKTHQTTLRNELYSNICDHLRIGDGDADKVGKSFILPAGFVGSKRYMQQNFQDALAVCRYVGHPDIFLTMTCNTVWDEIMQMIKLIPGGTPQNNPDIIARVFRLKLDQLLDDIQKKSFFGVCIGVMYVVEFQKRGLPHVHMLIWLDATSKQHLKANVDKFVSAEIPDPEVDSAGYAAVKAFMIHGPCGAEYPKSPCMRDSKCGRHFPKKYCSGTIFDDSGFPIYMRRNSGVTVKVRKTELDNQWVVPYNRDLLVKYQCHMNVEICSHARSVKYLFKYCLKGHDRATVEIRGQRSKKKFPKVDNVDEIQAFFDGRYICGCEAAYRTFGFDIHYRSISVQRLSYHLPGKKNCTFRSNESLKKVVAREKYKRSKLEAFFLLNSTDKNAQQYTFDEIPRYYVWNDTCHTWTLRTRGYQIGRLIYTHHSCGEVWFLRLLLSKVKGPTSFESLRTVNGVLFSTFQEACKEYGLLEHDDEWHEVLAECSKSGFAPQIRELFVHIMVNCQVTDLKNLWMRHINVMNDDILFTRRSILSNPNLMLNDKEIEYYALAEIDSLLKSLGKSLKDYPQMTQPPPFYLDQAENWLIFEETNYNRTEMLSEYHSLISNLNEEQIRVYDAVLKSVEKTEGGLFFVYGSGGCGKTYLWRTLICKLRSEGKIVLPVASSGIAATLLPGGRTAHSRFKIPIVLDDYSLCGIRHNSETAELIKRTSMIIWDEAPMQHRYAFECLDRSLRDLMKSVDQKRYHMPFGGITVVLGGDFRQILPVIPLGKRSDTVSACITRSRLWKLCEVFILKHNMRLRQGSSDSDREVLRIFAQWVLDVGDGKKLPAVDDFSPSNEFQVCIPSEFCRVDQSNSIENMIHSIYPNLLDNFKCPKYLSERAILTPTNQSVSRLNSLIVEKIPGETFSYFSIDKAEDFAFL